MNIGIPKAPRLQPNARFLELSYGDLEEKNLALKRDREEGHANEYFKSKLIPELRRETGIKAVTVCFSDMEGKLHMLDYNKKYLLDAEDNLTFDGSSIKGFTQQSHSDLRLKIDWSSFRWIPADIFGAGKVLLFASTCDEKGNLYAGDFRAHLMQLRDELRKEQEIAVHVAPEVEGFLLEGENAEQSYDEKIGFTFATRGGYFHSLPQDKLRRFIDRLAEATRAMGFENEKDHAEVAPSQFEMNYSYTDILHAADQVQIYKITARQIAKTNGFTACFLPKPVSGINGTGMHTNISLSRHGKNLFFDAGGKYRLSDRAHDFISAILYYAKDLCLILNSSVNAYRRLDPHFEAPNQIKMSPSDRGSMIRIPIGNERSARIEVRTVAPDANPYLAFYALLKTGLEGMNADEKTKELYKSLYNRSVKKLPGTIEEAISAFRRSSFIKKIMSDENSKKYLALKQACADRSPRELGKCVKNGEIWYHHEVCNQVIWNEF
ncbi:MAG: glutamine synthetase family protein [Candidatus Peregrinibacteria bacterium]